MFLVFGCSQKALTPAFSRRRALAAPASRTRRSSLAPSSRATRSGRDRSTSTAVASSLFSSASSISSTGATTYSRTAVSCRSLPSPAGCLLFAPAVHEGLNHSASRSLSHIRASLNTAFNAYLPFVLQCSEDSPCSALHRSGTLIRHTGYFIPLSHALETFLFRAGSVGRTACPEVKGLC